MHNPTGKSKQSIKKKKKGKNIFKVFNLKTQVLRFQFVKDEIEKQNLKKTKNWQLSPLINQVIHHVLFS